jgi:hypothetical protein
MTGKYMASGSAKSSICIGFLAHRCYREKVSLVASAVVGHVCPLGLLPRMLVIDNWAGG